MGTAIALGAVFISALTWLENRRTNQSAKYSRMIQSYDEVATRPILNAVGTVVVNGKTRMKLIIFNQRETKLKIHSARCYVYAPKPRTIDNWLRSRIKPFDWDFSPEASVWNPKGILDDKEHYADETLPFTLVKEHEFILISMDNFREGGRYKFEVITSQGIVDWDGRPPSECSTLPYNYSQRIF